MADMWSIWGAEWKKHIPIDNPSTQGAKGIMDAANNVVPLSSATRILDVGCGTGDLVGALAISNLLPKSAKIIASDLSPGMLAQTSTRGEEEGWNGVEYKILDATNMSDLKDGSFSHVLSNFAIYFL